MSDKTIKVPMIVGIVLQGIAVLIAGICYFVQNGLSMMGPIHYEGKVLPDALVTILIALMMHIISFLVVQTYEGDSKRAVGVILTVVYCALNILSSYASRIVAVFDSRKGTEYLAAKSVLASVISMFTLPFTVISLTLILIAIGRYGVSSSKFSE